MTVKYEARAKRDYGRLLEMGGRPTRPIRQQPTWTATYEHGLIFIVDAERGLDCTLSDDIDLTFYHWQKESGQFRRELKTWQDFRKRKERLQYLDRLET